MRTVLWILLGLAIGIIGTTNVMSVLAQRHPMPAATMHTMGYHMSALGGALKAKKCEAASIQHHLQRMQSTATDIVPVFGIEEKPFTDAASKLQTNLQDALNAAPTDCAGLAAVIKPIGADCKSCHEKYR